jgi:hypothetical protein
MSNCITETAQAVTDAINAASVAGTLGQKITAIRKWLPTYKLEELDQGILCLVVAKGIESQLLTRRADQEDVMIDVGLIVKMTNDDETTADMLFDLIEQIHGIMRAGFDIPSSPECRCLGRTTDPIFDVTKLEQQRLLRSATTYKFRVHHSV